MRRANASIERCQRSPIPRIDLLPALRRAQPGPDLFFQDTVHLTPHGHQVVADALDAFIVERSLLGSRSGRRSQRRPPL